MGSESGARVKVVPIDLMRTDLDFMWRQLSMADT